MSCSIKSEDAKFTKKVVDKASTEQLNKWGIYPGNRDKALECLTEILHDYFSSEEDPKKLEEMYEDIPAAIEHLEAVLDKKTEITDKEEANANYIIYKRGFGGRYDVRTSQQLQAEGKDEAKFVQKLETAQSQGIITYYKRDIGDGNHSYAVIVRQPRLEATTPQAKALDRLERIKNFAPKFLGYQFVKKDATGRVLDTRYYKSPNSAPAEFEQTGKTKYIYRGREVITNSVSNEVHGFEPNSDFPILASNIGTVVDHVGRDFFQNKFDGLTDQELQNLIDSEYRGIFSVQGLKNLIEDFKKLEKQLKETFGDDCIFYTEDIHLFGEKQDGEFVQGKPDIIVIDNKGKLHVIDMKSYKMGSVGNYVNFISGTTHWEDGKPSTFEGYGQQETTYIKMLQSYGLDTEEAAYIVLIDTWYDSSDHGQAKNEGRDDRRTVYSVVDYGPIGILATDQTLGQYAEANPVTRTEVLASTEQDTILYMEPRLHGYYTTGQEVTDEVKALIREEYGIEFNPESMSYAQQLTEMTEEEREDMLEFAGPPVETRDPGTLVKLLNNSDILGAGCPMAAAEIQTVADGIMYRVSEILEDLSRGKVFALPGVPVNNMGEPLKGRTHDEILRRIPVKALLDYAFKKCIDPTEEPFPTREQFDNGDFNEDAFEFEDEKDYENQAMWNRKKMWLAKHKSQLLEMGYPKLLALEKTLIPKQLSQNSEEGIPEVTMTSPIALADIGIDSGDNDFWEAFLDGYNEGTKDLEAWMMGIRHYSPKASLSQELRRAFENLYMKDDKGNILHDAYGWRFRQHLEATYVVQSLLEICKDCETMEQMQEAMELASNLPGNYWIKDVLRLINNPENKSLKAKFYTNFRKDFTWYAAARHRYDEKGNRIVETRIINLKSAQETLMQSVSASFKRGLVGVYIDPEFGGKYQLITPYNGKGRVDTQAAVPVLRQAADKLAKEIGKTWDTIAKDQKKEHQHGLDAEHTIDFLDALKDKGVFKELTNLLHGVGVMVTEDVVEATVAKGRAKFRRTNYAMKLLDEIKGVVEQLNKDKTVDKLRKPFPRYVKIVQMIADSVQEHVEASVYEGGKSYYSYTNPSRLQHIVRNLRDALNSEQDHEQYLEDNFGRYTGWFKDAESEEWLNDWVAQFAEDDNARRALAHKAEISYLGTQYKDMGSLEFQLSILHNYFGGYDDEEVSPHCRWFAMPTMSNKPTNEFIRMLKYRNEDAIVRKVLLPTFIQECNRMVDVLHHFASGTKVKTDHYDLTEKSLRKAGWTAEEIQQLKDKINEGKLTATDLHRLSKAKSGAKFHFLWYLNPQLLRNSTFGNGVAGRINSLLSGNKEDLNAAVDFNKVVRDLIKEQMDKIVEDELQRMKDIGLFATEQRKVVRGGKTEIIEVLKYQEEFGGKLGKGDRGYEEALKDMEKAVRDFIWQDIAANINIIQITGGDLAYFGDSVNYQKRIAMMHSPGLHMMNDEEITDGYLRSVHISDWEKDDVVTEVTHNAIVALEQHADTLETAAQQEEFRKMTKIIKSLFDEICVTDGQSFNSPTSIRKKLRLQGEWDDNFEEAYKRIKKGDFNINDLGVMLQPRKPFVASDMAKYSGSPTMAIRRTPLQDKSSEYLILLAEALSTAGGKDSKMSAIFKFMEDTHKRGDGRKGIDTVHFASVGKTGVSGVIDITKAKSPQEVYDTLMAAVVPYQSETGNPFPNSKQSKRDYDDIQELMQQGILKAGEVYWNSQYVDAIPLDDYVVQQNVPAHFLESENPLGQLYGSQSRILGISDITMKDQHGNDTMFNVKGEAMTAENLIDEYKKLHAANIDSSFRQLLNDFGLQETGKRTLEEMSVDERNTVLEKLEKIFWEEIFKDTKYGPDVRRACKLQVVNPETGEKDFIVPILDPIQSKRLQMLLNSVVKKKINKQRINGGSLVQATCYDEDLRIVFKGKDGKPLEKHLEDFSSVEEYQKYLKENQAGIAYFECYMPIPNGFLEKMMLNKDGSMMSYEELFDHEEIKDGKKVTVKGKLPTEVQQSISECIGYRIPTEDKYSMIPLKIKGFLPKAAGQVIMMPKEITVLTGSDFDIDKMYIMMKSFKVNGLNKVFLNGQKIDKKKRDQQLKEAIKTAYMEERGSDVFFSGFENFVGQVINNADKILRGDMTVSLTDWTDGSIQNRTEQNLKKANQFVQWMRDRIVSGMFEEFTDKDSPNYAAAKRARDNRLLDLQWAVLTHEDTMVKMLNPGNFVPQKQTGRIIRILKAQRDDASIRNPETGEKWTFDELRAYAEKKGIGALDELLENTDQHNVTLPSSKIYFQRQNMQGTQMVGIFANNNVSHAFCSFQKIGIDLYKGHYDNSFAFDGHMIGDPYEVIVLDPQKGFNGQYVSKVIASFLAASVDTAKDPVLADMNINTFTGNIAMVLARLGFDTEAIGLFLAQPVIVELSDRYFNRKAEGMFDEDSAIKELATELGLDNKELSDTSSIKDRNVLTKENLAENLANSDYKTDNEELEYQQRVLRAFYGLAKISKDLRELTVATKVNSVSNAAGPTNADTEILKRRIEKFTNSSDNVFYEPQDGDGFTEAQSVIKNDPILNAFYERTLGDDSITARISELLFPHSFLGFQSVLREFEDNYLKSTQRLDVKTYNRLLDEWLFYLLTLDAPGAPAALPSAKEDYKKLVTGIVGRFKDILKLKRTKPNIILDQGIGNNCLRVREADDLIATDTLIINSGQLNATEQESIRTAWTDLITMNDPNLSAEDNAKIRNFGIDLFFYSLLKNGFTFSPRTLMHLASVIVRYNATYGEGFANYIDALRNLKSKDNYIAKNLGDAYIHPMRFLDQYIRNHSADRKLVPHIYKSNPIVGDLLLENHQVVGYKIEAPEEDAGALSIVSKDHQTPKRFILLTDKLESGGAVQVLLQLDEEANPTGFNVIDGKKTATYRIVQRLGLTNSFIEYNANEEGAVSSFFEDIRRASESSFNDEEQAREGRPQDDAENQADDATLSIDAQWRPIRNVIIKMKGPHTELKEGTKNRTEAAKQIMIKLREAFKESARGDNKLAEKFRELVINTTGREELLKEIIDIVTKQNKC